jgi:nitrate/nitrite transporter NarK
MATEGRNAGELKNIPRGVWALDVSMFMDISSEMIHALLPTYLVSVLGASAMTVGLIEGMAESTAMVTKAFSGALSDWLGRRKILAAVGYGMAAFTKPVFPLADSIGHRPGDERAAVQAQPIPSPRRGHTTFGQHH